MDYNQFQVLSKSKRGSGTRTVKRDQPDAGFGKREVMLGWEAFAPPDLSVR